MLHPFDECGNLRQATLGKAAVLSLLTCDCIPTLPAWKDFYTEIWAMPQKDAVCVDAGAHGPKAARGAQDSWGAGLHLPSTWFEGLFCFDGFFWFVFLVFGLFVFSPHTPI